MDGDAPVQGQTAGLRTFLIADVRGYTRFTQAHGDANAARLAKKFADLARDAVEARGGRVIELRGDEALAVFNSTPQAVRAALELQATCSEETSTDPTLPMTIGIGIDVGEAIPVEDGFRGAALNTAARLCSRAAAGQVLVTRAVAESMAGRDEVRFSELGAADLKGFETAIDVIEAQTLHLPELRPTSPPRTQPSAAELPPELDVLMPLVDREHEMHWLRGTWRQARRGRGRVIFVSGPSQIGKTRLVAEIASEIAGSGDRVHYAGPGGAAAALSLAAIREATDAVEPVLVVLDDLDVAGGEAAGALGDAFDAIRSRPVLAIGLVKDPQAGPALAMIVENANTLGDGHVRLTPLDLKGVEGITRLYVGDEAQDAPLESMARASGGVPGRVHEVVSEWARDEAGRRLAAAAEFLAEGRGRRSADLDFANNIIELRLGRLYGEGERGAEDQCPYKGLASFDEADAAFFFGRERLVGELAARTVGAGLLGVVGASGSGKSSVVAAGLLPSLRAGLLPGSERWKHIAFRPGEHPLAELVAALAPDAPAPSAEAALAAAIERAGPAGRVVVAVDQFEEVFTLCADDAEREAFIDTLAASAVRSPEHIVFVLTIRDDFYGSCAPYRALADLLIANQVLVPPMTSDELRRAIELPARRARLRIETALVDALVAEVAEEPGGLPLLSAALVELWQARDDRWLRTSAYEKTGGVRGAVARLAEASYQQLGGAERQAARRILLRLADIGEGHVLTRRRVSLSEFDVGKDGTTGEVLTRLTRDRLLTMSDSTVEVAHEALLREWPRLRGWLQEDVQGHQLHLHLTQVAKQWDANAREASELYRGARLSAALDWSAMHGADLNELEREFLAQSRLASEQDAERQRRTNRRLRGLLVGTAVFLVVALVAGSLALVQRGNARREARVASARELASAAVANLTVDPERSILLALEAVDATWKADGTAVPEAEEALHRALRQSRVVLKVPEGGGLAVSADGKRFATTGQSGTSTIWDLSTGERLLTLRGHTGAVVGIAFSPDGSQIATTGADGTLRLWDARSAREIRVLRGHKGTVWNVAFSPDGIRLATNGEDHSVRLWNAAAGSGGTVLRPPGEGPCCLFPPGSPVFSRDGSRLVTATTDGEAEIWNLATRKVDVVLPKVVWQTSDVALSPAGDRVATGNAEGTAFLWDATSGRRLTPFTGHTGEIHTVDYSRDGTRIATGGDDGTARVWDAASGRQLLTLAGHSKGVRHVAFTPDGTKLLTGGADGTTRIWDISLTGGRDWLTVPGPALRLGGVTFSPDGKHFSVAGQTSGVTIRDAATGAVVIALTGHGTTITSMVFSPDGSKLAAASGSGTGDRDASKTIPIWDVTSGRLLVSLSGHTDAVTAVAFSPDGRRLASSSFDGTLRTWDVANGRQQRVLHAGADAYAFGFTPDGRWLLAGVGFDGVLTVHDPNTLEKRRELSGHTDYLQTLAFGSRGRIATASGDGTARVWELDSGRTLATLRGHSGPVLGVSFSPDGSLVATSSNDGTAKLWEAETGREVLTLFGHSRIVHTVAFNPMGRLLATASGDGTVALHLLPIAELRALASERVTRSLTDEECRQYLHVANCRARN